MDRRRILPTIVLALLAVSWPMAFFPAEPRPTLEFLFALFVVNLLAWALVVWGAISRHQMLVIVQRLAEQFGIETRKKSFERLTTAVLQDVERKNRALLPNLMERRINSKEELSRTLEQIVAHAFALLDAESAELALFDKESGLYHSSFVLGKPFRKSAQAMLAGALEDEGSAADVSADVLIEPLAFGGSVLGSLRVGLERGEIPTQSDREIMHLLALQGGMAVINSQYTDELKRMKRTSEESVRVKTGFLANLSHEIRAPLGIIINAVELVLDGLCGAINGEQEETLRMVKANGAHLLELINDVLDYAKVESGKLKPDKIEIVVSEILKDVIGVVRTQADAKGHKLTLRPGEEALTIACDRRHLRQMMINLLTNAIKYTPDGGQIEIWSERATNGKVKISVKDSGVGIDARDHEKVFAPFERIQHAYSINQVGTGLGMSLTKRLAEVNGGAIGFSSRLNHGSTFWLMFPAVEFNPAAIEQEEEPTEQPRGSGEAILLLESDDGERKMLDKHLSSRGFMVTAPGSKDAALEMIRLRRFALAILDNKLVDNPEEDLLKSLRNNEESAHLPIILLSSRAFVFDIEKYLRAGVDRCLSKPIALKELTKIARELIDSNGEKN